MKVRSVHPLFCICLHFNAAPLRRTARGGRGSGRAGRCSCGDVKEYQQLSQELQSAHFAVFCVAESNRIHQQDYINSCSKSVSCHLKCTANM